MPVSRDRLVDLVDRSLGLLFDVEGHFEWVDRTTGMRSYEWQLRSARNDRPSVAGECYLTFQREGDTLTIDVRASMEFRDIDRVRNTDLLERARTHLQRAYVEYRIVEEFAEEAQSFHVFVGTALFLEESQLASEDEAGEEIDVHLEALVDFAEEVDRMVYLESSDPRHIT